MRKEEERIITYTGREFWPLDPRPEDINALDICHMLSNTCRFSGAVLFFYSVAEHSCRVHDVLKDYSESVKLWAILHDASESYLTDLPKPVKINKKMEEFRKAEDRLMNAICEKFNLPLEEPREVEWADKTLLITEQRDLMPSEWFNVNGYKPLEERIVPMPPQVAKFGMIDRLEKLGIEVIR